MHLTRQSSDGQRTLGVGADHEAPEEYRDKDEEQAETDYLAPTRWWLSSTLFPLFAATFGPIASGFNICALVGHWVLVIKSGNLEEEGSLVTDPPWLYGVNAVSLFTAFIANLFLLGHMSSRVPFHIAQPITISGFFIASVLLIGLVAAVPIHLQGPGQTLAQGYYYACMAAFIYMLIAILLTTTLIGVYLGKYSREYKLTMAQRSLMFQTMTFVGYLLATAAVYSRIEGWFFLDAVYFATVTLFTIGFGDFTPHTHLGRSLFIPMAVGGILFVGLIVTSISSCVLEAGTKKITTRNTEKARQQVMRKVDSAGTIRVSMFHKKRKITLATGATEIEQREHEFLLMRLVQQKAAYDNSIIALSLSLGVFSFIWFIGSVVFWQSELGTQNWSYFESLYFTYVSFLTIGYGDFEVTSNAGKPAFVLWALLALPTLTVLIGAIGNTIGETVNTATLWIADHLSEATPGLRLLKHSAQKVKKGGNGGADDGGDHSAAKPAGFMEPDSKASSETDKNDDATDPTTAATTNTDAASALANSAHKPASSNITTDPQPPITRQTSTNPQTGAEDASQTDGIPTTTRTLLLLNELRTVLPHLDASPPRKYSYAEWVYILALLGSDENSPEHHRSAEEVRADEKRGIEGKSDSGDGGDENGRGDDEGASGDVPDVAGEKWSWLGRRSPLMSGMDEPRWVLEHIMRAMEKELRGMPGGSEERAKEEVRKTE